MFRNSQFRKRHSGVNPKEQSVSGTSILRIIPRSNQLQNQHSGGNPEEQSVSGTSILRIISRNNQFLNQNSKEHLVLYGTDCTRKNPRF